MRLLGMLLEFLIIGGLGFIIFSSIKALFLSNQKKQIWNDWLKTIEDDKNITEDSLLHDIETIIKVSEKNISNETLTCLYNIKDNILILKNSPKSLEQMRSTYPDDFIDLLNILHKYIPESLSRYFSIPEKMKHQEHRNGKNANELLHETFVSLEHRFDEITKNLISEKINELKTYQNFIHKKFD